jgi:hypothetical protein
MIRGGGRHCLDRLQWSQLLVLPRQSTNAVQREIKIIMRYWNICYCLFVVFLWSQLTETKWVGQINVWLGVIEIANIYCKYPTLSYLFLVPKLLHMFWECESITISKELHMIIIVSCWGCIKIQNYYCFYGLSQRIEQKKLSYYWFEVFLLFFNLLPQEKSRFNIFF